MSAGDPHVTGPADQSEHWGSGTGGGEATGHGGCVQGQGYNIYKRGRKSKPNLDILSIFLIHLLTSALVTKFRSFFSLFFWYG